VWACDINLPVMGRGGRFETPKSFFDLMERYLDWEDIKGAGRGYRHRKRASMRTGKLVFKISPIL
jgi:hypothetical protein